jgi:hypothetical protein
MESHTAPPDLPKLTAIEKAALRELFNYRAIPPEMQARLIKLRLAEQKKGYCIITELGHMTLVFGG